ncbi:hypothetical protein Xcel_0870 [Xylanimonas cellulosilytica DSM 15894]|uniref:Regulator of chromosome condensation RCC1 n=1 Tax=Xylanimonas cellulosilytica (strain DSM 15894 / JCM 12276 / CECT 5975 / KCTC 9989 / LMG 20990 / NBRC 107835 / XIL07) TaxID=446471 RepID=D1BY59_XYLCX|nr:hypothetical protein Xcel_0870 [Xylanimonas cellulosilytica DSM 15894]
MAWDGSGTYALWNDSTSAGTTGRIASAQVTIDALGAATYAVEGAAFDPAADALRPGQTLTVSIPVDVTVTGTTMTPEITVSDWSLPPGLDGTVHVTAVPVSFPSGRSQQVVTATLAIRAASHIAGDQVVDLSPAEVVLTTGTSWHDRAAVAIEPVSVAGTTPLTIDAVADVIVGASVTISGSGHHSPAAAAPVTVTITDAHGTVVWTSPPVTVSDTGAWSVTVPPNVLTTPGRHRATAVQTIDARPIEAATDFDVTSYVLGAPGVHAGGAGATTLEIRDGAISIGGAREGGVAGTGAASVAADSPPTRVTLPGGVAPVKVVVSTDNNGTDLGTTFVLALGSDGVAYQWGTSYLGRIAASTPTALRTYRTGGTANTDHAMPPIVDVIAADDGAYALGADGTLYSWGLDTYNTLPQPTVPTTAEERIPHASTIVSTVTNAAGTPRSTAACGTATSAGVTPHADAREVRWHSVWPARLSQFAVTQEGLIYGWGWDYYDAIPAAQPQAMQRCPRLVEGANKTLFTEYPDIYRDGAGRPYDGTNYAAVVANTIANPPTVCAGVASSTLGYDTGTCPVRQLGARTRSFAMVLQNGRTFTWVGTGDRWGWATLGRDVPGVGPAAGGRVPGLLTTDGSSDTSKVLLLDHFVAGATSIQAMGKAGTAFAGTVYGWGSNNHCQAVGAPPDGSGGIDTSGARTCRTPGGNGVAVGLKAPGSIWYPTPVSGVAPGSAAAVTATSACAVSVTTSRGEHYAFGGSTLRGYEYMYCTESPGARDHGYQINRPDAGLLGPLLNLPAQAQPWIAGGSTDLVVTASATGTVLFVPGTGWVPAGQAASPALAPAPALAPLPAPTEPTPDPTPHPAHDPAPDPELERTPEPTSTASPPTAEDPATEHEAAPVGAEQ